MRRRLALAVLVAALPALAAAQAPDPPHQHAATAGSAPRGRGSLGAPAAAPATLPPFIPPLTDADRAAAFPDVMGHAVHDNAVNYFVLFDQLEWQGGDGAAPSPGTPRGWIGSDRNRFWFRTEGEARRRPPRRSRRRTSSTVASIARWWDVVAGVRQDARPGAAQTWAAVGVQGLAPYWFEVEATAYVGASGRTQLRARDRVRPAAHQPPGPAAAGRGRMSTARRPESRGIGAGLTSVEAGLRLRYEFRREFAPYVGVTWQRRFFGTADYARADGDAVGGTRLAVGVRIWH